MLTITINFFLLQTYIMINKFTNSIKKLPSPILAIILMIISGMCASTMHCLIRVVTVEDHPFQVAFFRTVFVLIIFLPIVFKGGISSLKVVDKKLQTYRAIVGSVAMCCMFVGISITELAKATALLFTVPIFSTILAIIFFKEIVGVRRWIAMIIGMLGAMIVIRPDIGLGLGPLIILCGAITWSASLLMAKKLTTTETNTSMTFWQAAGLIPATLILSIPFLKLPGFEQLIICFFIAITGTLTHFCLNAALARAEISSLLPLDYLRLIWSVSLGFVFFSEIPLNTIWIGSALIIVATTYIAYRQVKKSQLTSKEINSNI